ncbi:LysR family transcriptional regulator [Enterobacter ludwigii]|uniref:LysR family transcriptional regulator n=1 Tax=Enterobacter ludwigii TaxID=299767 RepID=UPI0021516A88|nr:LysR family transcriptional regulator [Enterobacter ludwigii]
MNTKKPDVNLPLTLEALVAEQNVTRAASRLCLSQPAVSAQLNRLRGMFNDPLLIPGRRGMTPTPKALELMATLGGALAKIRDTLQSHEDFDPLHDSLTEIAPGVRIAVRNYDPHQLAHQLSSGDVDAAIATPDPAQAQLRTQYLYDESYVLIGRPQHPELNDQLTMEAFAKLEHIIVSPSGGGFTTPLDVMLAESGLQRKVAVSAASFLFVPGMVQMSHLVALVPRRLIMGTINPLTVVELPWLKETFDVSLIWHERSHNHAGLRWLRDTLVSLNRNADIS